MIIRDQVFEFSENPFHTRRTHSAGKRRGERPSIENHGIFFVTTDQSL